jgi:hypothetical protein
LIRFIKLLRFYILIKKMDKKSLLVLGIILTVFAIIALLTLSPELTIRAIITPECSDGILNQDETGVDCGGLICGACPEMFKCFYNSDCLSNICQDSAPESGIYGTCVGPPSCSDKILNQDETDVDCGGLVCEPCFEGLKCFYSSDCSNEICQDAIPESGIYGKCYVPPDYCFNGLFDQDETDVDCGGSCRKCKDNLRCFYSSDCVSNNCEEAVPELGFYGICIGSCSDKVIDQDETDVDCGGTICSQCSEDKKCFYNSDCVGNNCEGAVPESGIYGICKNLCISDFSCAAWGDCMIVYELADVLKGELVKGQQERVCSDLNKCRPARLEQRECIRRIPIRVEKEVFCFENYINLYDEKTGELITRIKQTDQNQMNIQFGVIEEKTCPYCHNKIIDYDEVYTDCGGAYCNPCHLDDYTAWALGRELDLKISQTTIYFDISGNTNSLSAKIDSGVLIIGGLTLNKGETINIDVNKDKKADIKVFFKQIADGKALVSMTNRMV